MHATSEELRSTFRIYRSRISFELFYQLMHAMFLKLHNFSAAGFSSIYLIINWIRV